MTTNTYILNFTDIARIITDRIPINGGVFAEFLEYLTTDILITDSSEELEIEIYYQRLGISDNEYIIELIENRVYPELYTHLHSTVMSIPSIVFTGAHVHESSGYYQALIESEIQTNHSSNSL